MIAFVCNFFYPFREILAHNISKSVLCLCTTDTMLGDKLSQSRNPENVSKYHLALGVRNIKQYFCKTLVVLGLNLKGYIRKISRLIIGSNSDWSSFRFFTSFAMLNFPGSFSQVFASLRVVCHSLHTLYFDKVEVWAHSFWSYTIVL